MYSVNSVFRILLDINSGFYSKSRPLLANKKKKSLKCRLRLVLAHVIYHQLGQCVPEPDLDVLLPLRFFRFGLVCIFVLQDIS